MQPTLSSPHARLCISSSPAHLIISLVVVVVVIITTIIIAPASPFTHEQHPDPQHASKSSRGLKVSDAITEGKPHTTYDGWLHFSYPNNVVNKAISRRHALIKVFPVTVRTAQFSARRK